MSRVPVPGDTLSMLRAGARVTVGRQVNQGAQGIVYEATLGGTLLALKWLRGGPRTASLQRSNRGADRAPAPAQGIRLADRPRHEPGDRRLRLRDAVHELAVRLVLEDVEERGRISGYSSGSGATWSMRSHRSTPRATAIATSASATSSSTRRTPRWRSATTTTSVWTMAEVFVKGSNEFMAPEILRDELLPCTATDLYSLAVFLFMMFVRGHPLEGMRANSTYSWGEEHHVSSDDLMRRNFGSDALFVFDPNDDSNRPPAGDAMLTYWAIYPLFFRALFERAFTTGLRTASVSARVTPGAWRRSLVRLSDLSCVCSCSAEIFWDPDDPSHACWNCATVVPRPHLLEIRGHTVVLCEGASVTSHHLNNDRSYDLVLGAVERHPDEPGCVTLRNLSDSTWSVVPDGETQKTVVPTQRLLVRPMDVDFGSVQGRIT